MDAWTKLVWLAGAAMWITGAVVFVLSYTDSHLDWRVQRFVDRHRVAIDGDVTSALRQRIARELRQDAWTSLAAAPAFLAAWLLLPDGVAKLGAVGVLALFVALDAGLAASTVRRPLVTPGAAPRVARVRSVETGDLVSPWLRLAALTHVVLLTLVALPYALRATQSTGPRALSGLVVVGVVGVLLCCEFSARWVSGQPEPARNRVHLYVEDALRAESLHSAYLGGLLAGNLTWTQLAFWGPDQASTGAAYAAAAFGALGVTLVAFTVSEHGGGRYRRRLWPDLGPREVLTADQERVV